MCTCEETSNSQLGAIQNNMARTSPLRARTIYLRRISQENHVKRMQLARSMGESPSPVFILPSSSSITEPKYTQINSPPKPISPNKTAIKENIQDKCETFTHSNITDQATLKNSTKDGSKHTPAKNGDKICGKPSELKRITVKSTLSLGRYLKRGKLKCKETEKKFVKNKALGDKNRNKYFTNESSTIGSRSSTPVITELSKGSANLIDTDSFDKNYPKQMSPKGRGKTEKVADFQSEQAISSHELLKVSNKSLESRKKLVGDRNNKTVKTCDGNNSLKRYWKKKKKANPRKKVSLVKSPQNEKKITETKITYHESNMNKTILPVNIPTPKTMPSTATKDSSLLSRSMSLDSLDDRRKSMNAPIFSAPRTIDKVQNFINDKKGFLKNTPLECENQLEKMYDNSGRPPMKLYGLSIGSKIPFHEFRTQKIRNRESANEISGEPFHSKLKVKNKECFTEGCSENTWDVIPVNIPFKTDKSLVKSWLNSVPDVTKTNEKTGKKARELVPNSKTYISLSISSETIKRLTSKNDATKFCDVEKNSSTFKKTFNNSPINKTPENKEHIDVVSRSASNSKTALPAESGIEEGKRFEVLKDNLSAKLTSPTFNFTTHNKEFLTNPIEKFMSEIYVGMNLSDSDDIKTESSQASISKGKKKENL